MHILDSGPEYLGTFGYIFHPNIKLLPPTLKRLKQPYNQCMSTFDHGRHSQLYSLLMLTFERMVFKKNCASFLLCLSFLTLSCTANANILFYVNFLTLLLLYNYPLNMYRL